MLLLPRLLNLRYLFESLLQLSAFISLRNVIFGIPYAVYWIPYLTSTWMSLYDTQALSAVTDVAIWQNWKL